MLRYLLAAAMLAVPSAAPAPPVPGSEVALLRCGNAAGTAFWIAPNRIISAAHVVTNGPCSINGVPVQVVRQDNRDDIAELRGTGGVVLPFRCNGFRRGRLYHATGFAGGRYLITTPLISTGGEDSDGMDTFVGQVERGMSGGPVVDRRGRVVGIVNRHSPARSRSLEHTFICEDNA